MPLRNTLLEKTAETREEFIAAAEEKYWEGFALIVEGHYGAGIYLLGYTAEMLLKNACLELRDVTLTDPLYPQLKPAWDDGTTDFSASFARNSKDYHNLDFWSRLLREERRRKAIPFPHHVDIEFQSHASLVHTTWWVEMRYRRDFATMDDAKEMFEAVSWLRKSLA